jgi:Kef-type K+ transport system membrane component KefB
MLTSVLAVATVIMAGLLSGRLARWLRQPAVAGQMLAGVLLGRGALGALDGRLWARLFTPVARHDLALLGDLALVLFMFALGFEIDRAALRRNAAAVPLVAALTVTLPLGLGAASALALAGFYRPAGQPSGAFVLFFSVAITVTALPVLAAIVRERGMTRSLPATIAVSAAVLIDALCWLLLTVALLLAHERVGLGFAARVLLLGAWALTMVALVRPALGCALRAGRLPQAVEFAVLVALAIGSAWVTSRLGVHPILGAFLAGAVVPRAPGGKSAEGPLVPLRSLGGALLPVFILTAGLPTDLAALGARDLVACALILSVSFAGKLGGGWLAARLAGLSSRDAAVVGALLNTRGVTELVVLSVGLSARLIGPHAYTVFVLMALITSAATGPLLSALRRLPWEAQGEPERAGEPLGSTAGG